MNKVCKMCGKEYAELDPIGPEQVDNPIYVPDCECLIEDNEIVEN